MIHILIYRKLLYVLFYVNRLLDSVKIVAGVPFPSSSRSASFWLMLCGLNPELPEAKAFVDQFRDAGDFIAASFAVVPGSYCCLRRNGKRGTFFYLLITALKTGILN